MDLDLAKLKPEPNSVAITGPDVFDSVFGSKPNGTFQSISTEGQGIFAQKIWDDNMITEEDSQFLPNYNPSPFGVNLDLKVPPQRISTGENVKNAPNLLDVSFFDQNQHHTTSPPQLDLMDGPLPQLEEAQHKTPRSESLKHTKDTNEDGFEPQTLKVADEKAKSKSQPTSQSKQSTSQPKQPTAQTKPYTQKNEVPFAMKMMTAWKEEEEASQAAIIEQLRKSQAQQTALFKKTVEHYEGEIARLKVFIKQLQESKSKDTGGGIGEAIKNFFN